MNKIRGNECAFPLVLPHAEADHTKGVTIRQYFAAMAMQGILSNHWCQSDFNGTLMAINQEQVAKQSVGYADALIAELNKIV